MLGVLADHHDNAFSLDDLAFLAHFLDGRFHFHFLSSNLMVDYKRRMILPLVGSYTLISTRTRSPGMILM